MCQGQPHLSQCSRIDLKTKHSFIYFSTPVAIAETQTKLLNGPVQKTYSTVYLHLFIEYVFYVSFSVLGLLANLLLFRMALLIALLS